MSPRLPFARTILVAGLVALSVAACGRRGPLEAPGSAPTAGGATAAGGDGILASPVGTPARGTRQPTTVPKEPFILDPLL